MIESSIRGSRLRNMDPSAAVSMDTTLLKLVTTSTTRTSCRTRARSCWTWPSFLESASRNSMINFANNPSNFSAAFVTAT